MVAVAGKAQLTTEYTLRPQPTTEAAVLTNTASHCGPSSAHPHIFTVNFSSLSQSRWEPLGSRLGWQRWWKNKERVA